MHLCFLCVYLGILQLLLLYCETYVLGRPTVRRGETEEKWVFECLHYASLFFVCVFGNIAIAAVVL